MGYPLPAGQLEEVYLEEAVMSHCLASAALGHVPLLAKESWDFWSRGGRQVAYLSSWSKVTNDLKTQSQKRPVPGPGPGLIPLAAQGQGTPS